MTSLARHRLGGRAAASLLLAAAVAAATGVTGTIAALGASAADEGVARALDSVAPADRSLRVSGYAPSSDGAGDWARAATRSIAAAGPVAEPPAAGVILRRVRDPAAPYDLQLVATDDVGHSVALAEGTLPARCDGTRCEALLLSRRPTPADLPATVHVGRLEVRIVGRATLTSDVPLGTLDERGAKHPPADAYSETTDAPPALLLVDGAAAAAASTAAGAVGRTYLWTAPLRTAEVHPWTVPALGRALDRARALLAADAPDLTLSAPLQPVEDELALARANAARLLLVGSLGAAILLAFAAYAALLGRRDLRHELDRLAAAGADRRARATLVLVESAVPVVAGGLAGWLVAVGLAPLVAPGAAGDRTAIVGHVLLDPQVAAIGSAVVGAALAAVLLGLVGRAGRGALPGLLPGLALAALLVAWRASGGFDVGSLAGATDLPFVALLPAFVGLAIAGLSLATVPGVLRRLARSGARAGLPVRLALLSVARDPTRPAATLTLLAFGLGGLVFAVADGATLDRGIVDQAAFRTGMDLRVVEAGTDLTLTATVVPFDRYARLPAGAHAWPTARVEAVAGGAVPVSLLGLPPDAIPRLREWRSDNAALDPSALAAAIAVPGTFAVPGHRLPAGTDLAIPVTVAGDPVDLTAVVETDAGDAVRVFLGTATVGTTTVHGTIPEGAVGGRIVAIVVAEDRLIAGQDHPAKLGRATLTFPSLDGLLPATPIDVTVSGLDKPVLRAHLPTDGLALPAIVSPDVAALAARSPDGTIPVTLADRSLARIRVAAVATRFPTIVDPGHAFAVVALDPLLVALDGDSPGAGHPDEAWIRVDDGAALGEVVGALRAPPFRSPAIVDREALTAAGRADPFARSVAAAFGAAGLAGLLLAALGLVLGAAADLADETGELRDLEAQGLGPAALRRHVAIRTGVLAVAGILAGLAVGLVLAAWVTVVVAVSAQVGTPMPPLALVIPWPAVLLAVAVPLLAAAGVAWLAARWSFRRASRGPASHARPIPAAPVAGADPR